MAGSTAKSLSASTPQLVSSTPATSKLPKFLHRQPRDRSKSNADLQPLTAGPSSSSSSSPPPSSFNHTIKRRTSKLLGLIEKDEVPPPEPPTIVEPAPPLPSTRSRLSSEYRPMSSVSDGASYSTIYPSTSAGRLSDLPSRLSGWISHTLTGSATDLSLPSLLSQSQLQSVAANASPKSKSVGLLTAARHGKGHLDKAMRYLLDTDAQPDKSTDPIWILGVPHPGYEPSPPILPPSPVTPPPARRNSTDSRRSPSSRRSSGSSSSHSHSTLSTSQSASSSKHVPAWPQAFYSDFTSRIWLTYRSHFPPIRDVVLASLDNEPSEVVQLSSSQSKRWNWPVGGDKGCTSDAGWGCMLRTGQSMLANALIHLHLTREWRRPQHCVPSQDYVTYVKILTWFLDSPSTHCPFGVHRMALAGKELGKNVGQWFGPSTAAGAIKRLVHEFPEAQLAVSVAADGVVYDSDVYAASHFGRDGRRRHLSHQRWGRRAVLVLVGIRLGIDGVNPIYYEGLKTLFTFPQSVGIAGGRPSSSYYFVGTQGNNLFYLDPHHTRPAITFRPPPEADDGRVPSPPPRATESPEHRHQRRSSPAFTQPWSPPTSPAMHHTLAPSPLSQEYLSSSPTDLDPVMEHYAYAYAPSELRTFHCDRVRKMPLSGMDPSMLLGFLCRDEADYHDFRVRVADLSKKHKIIFSTQEEPPSWGDDSSDMGLESLSEPDLDHDHEGDGEDEGEDASFSNSPSPAPPSIEDSPSLDPVTPNTRPDYDADADVNITMEDGDEWVAPSPPTSSRIKANGAINESNRKGKEPAKQQQQREAPQVMHFPFPSSDDSNELKPLMVSSGWERERAETRPPPHLRSIRARNGGRTQSGGVKGVWTDGGEGDDF